MSDDTISSVVPSALNAFDEELEGLQGKFNNRLEDVGEAWDSAMALLHHLPPNQVSYHVVALGSPIEDAENIMETWTNRREFVSDVLSAFIEADSEEYPDVVMTLPTSEVTLAVGRTAEELEEMGVSPADATKIAEDGSPELFDAVLNGELDPKVAARVADLPETDQRNVLRTGLPADEVLAVLNGKHGEEAVEALLNGHGHMTRYWIRANGEDHESRTEATAVIHFGDAAEILLEDGEVVTFEELDLRFHENREDVIAYYVDQGLSEDEANDIWDEMLISFAYLGNNEEALDEVDRAGDPDTDNPQTDGKFSVDGARRRQDELIPGFDNSVHTPVDLDREPGTGEPGDNNQTGTSEPDNQPPSTSEPGDNNQTGTSEPDNQPPDNNQTGTGEPDNNQPPDNNQTGTGEPDNNNFREPEPGETTFDESDRLAEEARVDGIGENETTTGGTSDVLGTDDEYQAASGPGSESIDGHSPPVENPVFQPFTPEGSETPLTDDATYKMLEEISADIDSQLMLRSRPGPGEVVDGVEGKVQISVDGSGVNGSEFYESVAEQFGERYPGVTLEILGPDGRVLVVTG